MQYNVATDIWGILKELDAQEEGCYVAFFQNTRVEFLKSSGAVYVGIKKQNKMEAGILLDVLGVFGLEIDCQNNNGILMMSSRLQLDPINLKNGIKQITGGA